MRTFNGYPLRMRPVSIAGREYRVLGPDNFEQLVDDPRTAERFRQDEYLPYWAEFWPACVLLAEEVAAWNAPRGVPPTVLELGAGLGLVSLVLSGLGYPVVCSDYDEDALAFVRASAAASGVPLPATRRIDWRERYDDLRVDRIVAAEITYETRSLRPIAEFISNHLRPGGFALLCDANRRTADDFPVVARHCGLRVETTPAESMLPGGGAPVRGRFFRLERRAGATPPE